MDRILPPMKHETHAQYDPSAFDRSLSALLTIWPGLHTYHQDLVLIGGLVPRFLCNPPVGKGRLPGPVTLDVDLGIALGASAGQYGSLSSDLRGQGFSPSETYPGRFLRRIGSFTVYVDFLVEDGDTPSGTRMVDDVPANVLPGVERALATAREVQVEGTDLFGARQKLRLRVCEIGPFLVLKLRALLRRQQGKDAFDLLYALLQYDLGTDAACEAFAQEVRMPNPAVPDALEALRTLFDDEASAGPIKAAHFVHGPVGAGEPEDLQFRRLQLQQDAVSVGMRLKAAIHT